MRVDEFVEGPCRWQPRSPVRLRRQVLADASAWQSYSTAGRLAGAPPCVVRAIPLYESSSEPGMAAEMAAEMAVEWLPETLTGRWRALGLRFASEAAIGEMGFFETLARSIALIRMVSPLHGSVAGLCRCVHVLLASGEGVDVSYSDPALPFSVFVSCAGARTGAAVERLAESLVHEALHLQLSLVERVELLVFERANEKRLFSPWKQEMRDVRGLLHAVYVFGNLRCFWQRVASRSPQSSSFARSRIAAISEELAEVSTLARSRSLTRAGRLLAESFLMTS